MSIHNFNNVWAPGHTSNIFDPIKLKILTKYTVAVTRHLKKILDFNTLAVCGHSGIVLGTLVSTKLKMPLLVVRKDGDQAHDDLKVNGYRSEECKYLILDDLISSGNTIRHVLRQIYETAQRKNDMARAAGHNPWSLPTPAGILLYESFGGGKECYDWNSKEFYGSDVPGSDASWHCTLPTYYMRTFVNNLLLGEQY